MSVSTKRLACFFYLILFPFMCQKIYSQINLVDKRASSYIILLPEQSTELEKKAAIVLQDYIFRVSDCKLEIVEESLIGKQSIKSYQTKSIINIGETSFSKSHIVDLPSEGFLIQQVDKMLLFQGTGKGVLYAVYSFVEEVLGCRKWYANEAAVCPPQSKITLPLNYQRKEEPSFNYREVYFPVESDIEYVDWHRIHLLYELWGLWGHTFNSLIPPEKYFSTHPDYFSYFNGSRQSNQLCLTNSEGLEIAVQSMATAIKSNPDATFWSISPNDDPVYCECDNCIKLNEEEGGPQGAFIYYVNKIAERFPENHFTALAYTYTAQPTKNIKPLKSVTLFLSNIEAYRTQPISIEPSAKVFRSQLDGWMEKTNRVFIWDYYTQFTNYLAPFPNLYTFQENLKYYERVGVKGVFAQGSGESYSEMAELKSYLLSKLLWNPSLDVDSLMDEFLTGYYGNSSRYVKEYIQLINQNVQKDTLDIYGTPISYHRGYLSLKNMDNYSSIMDKAEAAVEGNVIFEKRIERLRLPQEYTFLQQARFYGIEAHGVFYETSQGQWEVNNRLRERIKGFVENCNESGVKELSEGAMSPNQYQKEWDYIINLGVKRNLALNAKIFDVKHSFETSFPAKGWRTLVDGNPGYDDFSYNWLCFYGKPMEFSLDLGAVKKVEKISMDFLMDPRHWIFTPKTVNVKVSVDGVDYRDLGTMNFSITDENYEIDRAHVSFKNQVSGIRFIKVSAVPFETLPKFRFHKTKKPMIACDEIWVE